MLSLSEHVDEIIKLDLAGRMKKVNFRKRKNGFWRETQSKGGQPTKVVQAIDVQVGGGQNTSEGIVTAKAGVFFLDLMPIITPWQKKAPSPVTANDCHVKMPIGLLGPWKNEGHTWPIGLDQTQDAVFAKELADAVETWCVPYVEAALDLDKIAAGEVPGADPYLMVLALQRQGKKDAATAKVEEILAANPGRYMEVASFAGRLKLRAPPKPAK